MCIVCMYVCMYIEYVCMNESMYERGCTENIDE